MGLALAPWKVEPGQSLQRRIDAMAEELARQAADLAAAEYRWLRLLAEFDEIGGWAVGGARSCAAWLSWACGVSMSAAREKVRVARALPALPLVSAAFAEGRMSYSKVRAVTRVATEANESVLVDYALSATAAQLETVLRGYRRTSRLEEAAEDAQRWERRRVHWWVDDEGFVRIDARLAPDDGALVIGQMERLAQSGGEEEAAPAADPAGPVGASAEAAEAGRGDRPLVSHPLDASDPVEARRADALRIMAETAAAHGPSACIGGDTHLVVMHADHDELRSDEDTLANGDADGTQRGETASAEAPPLLSAPDPAIAVGTHIERVGRVSAETARRIACDAEIITMVENALGRPLGVGRSSKKVPRWLRRALKRRDGGRCRFPGCPVERFVDAHHIWHWADGGPTDLDNLILLCRFHHRLVHEVGYRIRVDGPGEFTFLRPDDSVVAETMPPVTGDGQAVERANAAAGLTITELTGIPDWDGTPPDYSWAIEGLHAASAEAPPTMTDDDNG